MNASRELEARFPSVARAVEPERLPPSGRAPIRRDGEAVCFENYFWADQVRNFTMRSANDPAAVFAMTGRGWCLFPLVDDGDVLHYDPTLRARCGDIVLFEPRPEPGNIAPLFRFQSKILTVFGGEYWLSFRDGMFPLADTKILGVAVRHSRGVEGGP
jgi:hypothetical protein